MDEPVNSSTENPFKNEPVFRFFQGIINVKGDPRSLILITNGFLELLIETLIKVKCKNSKKIINDSRSYPYSSKLILLHEIGVLKDNEFNVYDYFRKLRNRAAHEPFFTVTRKELDRFKGIKHSEDKLYGICVDIVGSLWNKHVEVFRPVFAPGLEKIAKTTDDNPAGKSPKRVTQEKGLGRDLDKS